MARRSPNRKRAAPPPQPPGAEERIQGWLAKRQGLVLAVVLAVFGAGAALAFDPKPFVGGDNATYVLLGQSLARGQGLAEFWTPQSRPLTLYPFGFPLLLAPVALLKLSYPWYKIVPLLSALVSLSLLWSLLRDRGIVLATATALLCAVNPTVLEYSHWVLSELPFMAGSLLAIYLLHRWEATGGRWAFAGALACAVFTNHIRSAGVALLAAVIIYLLVRRRFKAAAVFAAGCLALSIPWAWRNHRVGQGLNYIDWLLVRDPYQLELGRVTLAELVQRLWHNMQLYFGSIIPRLALPAIDVWGLALPGWLWCGALVLPMAGSMIARLATGSDLIGWYVLIYMGTALVWPEVWTDVRFVLPVAPFLLYYLLRGYDAILRRLFPRLRTLALLPVFLVLLAAALAPSISNWAGTMAMQSAYRAGDRLAGYDPAWRSFFAAAQWAGQHTPPQSVIVSRKQSLFYLTSGRRTIGYPFTENRDSVVAAVAQADYVMVEPVSGTVQRYLIPAVQPLIDTRFRVIYAAGDPPTYVLQVTKEHPDAKAE